MAMPRITHMLAAALSLASLTLPAQAQEQTPENARTFLAQVMPGMIGEIVQSGWKVRLLKVDPVKDDICYFGYEDDYLDSANRRTGSGGNFFRFNQVLEVNAQGSDVLVTQNNGREVLTITWHAGSEAMGARIAYAMEFLRTHCDRTRGTGF